MIGVEFFFLDSERCMGMGPMPLPVPVGPCIGGLLTPLGVVAPPPPVLGAGSVLANNSMSLPPAGGRR